MYSCAMIKVTAEKTAGDLKTPWVQEAGRRNFPDCVISLAYSSADCRMVQELPAGKEGTDVVYGGKSRDKRHSVIEKMVQNKTGEE